MPARPLAGPSDQVTPRGRKLLVNAVAACVRGESLDRPPRSGGIGGTRWPTLPSNYNLFGSVPPCLRF